MTSTRLAAAHMDFRQAIQYIKGDGVDKDATKAASFMRRSADAGYDKAQYNLGVMYLNGIGVEKSDNEAREWLNQASDQGHRQAVEALLNFPVSLPPDIPNSKDEVVARTLGRTDTNFVSKEALPHCPVCNISGLTSSKFCISCGFKFEKPSPPANLVSESVKHNVEKVPDPLQNYYPPKVVDNVALSSAKIRKLPAMWAIICMSEIVFILGFQIFIVNPHENSVKATPTSSSPMKNDSIYKYASDLTSHFRPHPACQVLAQAIMNVASSQAPDYIRELQIDKIYDKLPEFCAP